MTVLKGKVERETMLEHRGRRVVVGLEAPGTVTVRLKGTRQVFDVPVTTLYELAVKRHVDADLRREPARKTRINRGLLRP